MLLSNEEVGEGQTNHDKTLSSSTLKGPGQTNQ